MASTTFWSNRPTLVTGATGLVGGWVVAELERSGAQVVALVRDWNPRSTMLRSPGGEILVRGEIEDQSLMERVLGEYEIATVIHLAAQTIVTIANRNPVSTFESNIRGTWSLLEACRRSPLVQQIVVASSDKAYGAQPTLPYTESTPLHPSFPYDVSKACADLLSQSYAATFGLNVVVTRCGNFFGGGDLNWNRIIPGTIRSILQGERPVIRSDGSLVRDYFYVEDGAAAYLMLAEQLAERPELRGQAFNFSNETPLSVRAVVDRICAVLETDLVPLVRNEVSGEIPQQWLSSSKAREMLDWRPLHSFEEGLSRTVQWYRTFFAETR